MGRSNTYEFKFNGEKILLKSAKDNKTLCYLVTRPHFSPKSPIDGSTLRFRNSLGLLSLPLGISHIIIVDSSASHLHELHDHYTRQMTNNNYNFQSAASGCKISQ